jgi:hypothetical protein
MFNVNFLFQLLNEMNDVWMERISEADIAKYKKELSAHSEPELKQKFFEILMLDVESESLRERFRTRLKQRLKTAGDDTTTFTKEDQHRLIYAENLLKLLAYLSKNSKDLETRLGELFPPAPQPEQETVQFTTPVEVAEAAPQEPATTTPSVEYQPTTTTVTEPAQP